LGLLDWGNIPPFFYPLFTKNMKHFIFSIILGFYLMIALQDMSMAADIPAPVFSQPGDAPPPAPQYSQPKDGAVPAQKFSKVDEKNNIIECAKEALSNKFPFDLFGVFKADAPAASACPRIVLFDNTPASIGFEMCFVLNTIALLKYPVLIGLAISVLISI
jgi:hypothetical protein